MTQRVIDNPIINRPFEEPTQHFKFDEQGITSLIVPGRRESSYFMPIAKSRKSNGQMKFDTDWTADRIEPNKFINQVRERVSRWRLGGYQGVTPTTRKLLAHWTNPEREKKFFFCQIEALETAIYITECARKFGDAWIEEALRVANEGSNPGLNRVAFKMATGTGKTVVMAMLIAWQALNKIEKPTDARFSDAFLLIAPGITIRDRLRVLLPNDEANYYRQRDIIPPDLADKLGRAKILITNFHTFKQRELLEGISSLTKKALAPTETTSAFLETPDQMVRRVCRELGNKKNIIILNDEAHHCYRRRPDGEEETLTGDELAESKAREAEARIWISGVEAVQSKLGVRAIYDLSATPFFLKGSGWPEGTLFPWVVSDFSLIDAIESGIVKVPRVPVADDSGLGTQPAYRDLWVNIKDALPKKGRGTDSVTGEPHLPVALEGALQSLYLNYKEAFERWEQNDEAQAKGLTAPVFIVVCNNTNVSKLVYDYIAGWDKPQPDKTTLPVPGKLPLFSNIDNDRHLARPYTILVDSQQLESGEAMTEQFKKIAAREIEEFRAEFKARFPGRDPNTLSDSDILREVMNTVGKPGKLGEQVRCVVSVSMLTEGWDANTVTHILGVRAFGTQLLCEQVVGRGLRRMSYAANEAGYFEPEYAEVYGVPFSFIPCSGAAADPKPGPIPTRVRALPERDHLALVYPRLQGYRYEVSPEDLAINLDDTAHLVLSTRHLPTRVENAPIVGESSIHTLDELKKQRLTSVVFSLTKRLYERHFRGVNPETEQPEERPWLFPKLLPLVRGWVESCLECHDNTFPQMLLLSQPAEEAIEKIQRAIISGSSGHQILQPILYPYDTFGSTHHVDFTTTRPTWQTRPDRCPISHVVADTDSWEQKVAETLEDLTDVVESYAKNQNVGFSIPYTHQGETRQYYPDFLVKLHNRANPNDFLMLILEVSGEKRKDKEAKVATAQTLWVPAVNNHGGLGRWAFLEVQDPWHFKDELLAIAHQHETATPCAV